MDEDHPVARKGTAREQAQSMANAFVGLPVLVKLRSGPNDAVKGVLSSLDPAAGTLTLTEARTTVGGVERLEGIRVLSRNEVAGLELLSVSRSAQPAPVRIFP